MTTTLELHVRKIQWFCQQGEGFCMHVFSSLINKSRTQDVNSSNDAIKNLKCPVLWLNFIHQPTIFLSALYMKIFEQLTTCVIDKILISTSLDKNFITA
jgi:hypothetical protein